MIIYELLTQPSTNCNVPFYHATALFRVGSYHLDLTLRIGASDLPAFASRPRVTRSTEKMPLTQWPKLGKDFLTLRNTLREGTSKLHWEPAMQTSPFKQSPLALPGKAGLHFQLISKNVHMRTYYINKESIFSFK